MNKTRILLIEDDEKHIELIANQLYESELLRFTVDTAETLQKGQKMILENEYDVILSDLTLPDSKYNETLQSLKGVVRDAPIIVLTSLDDRNTILGMIESGADDCIPKSQLSSTLLERSIIYGIDRFKNKYTIARQLQLNKTITDNAASCLFMMDKEGHSTFMNPTAETVTGYTLDEIRDMPLHDAIHHHHPDGRPYPMCDCPIDNAQSELVEMKDYEDIFIRKDGSFFPVICYIAPLEENGKVVGSVLDFRDVTEQKEAEKEIRVLNNTLEQRVVERTEELANTNESLKLEITERKKAEGQVKASLKEKEILLKEIHHRVKNNMNVIVSLLRIQSQSIKDKQLLDIFKDCENRVNSMSLIHEALYQTKDLAEIDLAEYIRNLANRVVNSYKVHTDKFSLNASPVDSAE